MIKLIRSLDCRSTKKCDVNVPKPAAAAIATTTYTDAEDRPQSSGKLMETRIKIDDDVGHADKRPCDNGCGWTAYQAHPTCCTGCQGTSGPHTKDCSRKNTLLQPPCSSGCGRLSFASFPKCCSRCRGPEGPHARDCAEKCRAQLMPCMGSCKAPVASSSPVDTRRLSSDKPAAMSVPKSSSSDPVTPGSVAASTLHSRAPAVAKAKSTAPTQSLVEQPVKPIAMASAPPAEVVLEDVEERLRAQLAEWHGAGAMRTPAEIDEVILILSSQASMDPAVVRMLWLSIARQARPREDRRASSYVELTMRHHGIAVIVFDLGQYSAERANSCMFLSCAAAVADRRLNGHDDAWGLGALAECLENARDWSTETTIERLVEEHKLRRTGALGRMADSLRHAACEVLVADEAFYLPFFFGLPRSGTCDSAASASATGSSDTNAYHQWVASMRGDEEGDELVVLALSRLLGMAVQPVQQSGYRVPIMDPTGAADSGYVTYWGNNDRHWVWLRVV